MTISNTELRERALAATQGPWAAKPYGEKSNNWQVGQWYGPNSDDLLTGFLEDDETFICVEPVCEMENARGFADAKYIAAANPATILHLLDENEAKDSANQDLMHEVEIANAAYKDLIAENAALHAFIIKIIPMLEPNACARVGKEYDALAKS